MTAKARSSGTELTVGGRLLLLLAWVTAGAAWMTGSEASRLVAALLAAPLLIDLLWKGRRLPQLQILLAPRRCEAGAPFVEQLVVVSPARARTLRDVVLHEPRTRVQLGGAAIGRLGAGEQVRLAVRARARSRGRMRQRLFRVETWYPFGFIRQWRDLRVETDFVVEPARVEPPPIPASEAEAGRREEPRGLHGVEFHSLREYAAGEDARLVHALRSASAGVLQRRVLLGEDARALLIIVDLRLPPGSRRRTAGRRLEWSLSAAAALIDRLLGTRRPARFALLGETIELHDLSGNGMELLARLAELRAVPWRALTPRELDELRSDAALAWLPAGGYAAADDRLGLGSPLLLEPVR